MDNKFMNLETIENSSLLSRLNGSGGKFGAEEEENGGEDADDDADTEDDNERD